MAATKMFRINASEAAALVGLNPYKKVDEAIKDCYNRNAHGLPSQEYMRAKQVCNKNREVARAYKQMSEDAGKTQTNEEVIQKKAEFSKKIQQVVVGKVDEEITKIKESFEQDIQYARTRSDKARIEEMYKVEMEKLDKKKVQAVQDAKDVEKDAMSKINCNYGTRKETDVAASYEEITGMNVQKSNDRHVWEVAPGFGVVGKFDGFADDGTLVEIKNRVRRLFGEVKEYESVQVHVYMKMCEATNAHLVEKFQGKLMVHEVHYDDDLMCEIEAGLESAVAKFREMGWGA